MMLMRSGQILTLHRAMAQPVEQVVFESKFADYGDHGSLLCAHKRRGFGKTEGNNTMTFPDVEVNSTEVQREDNWANCAGRSKPLQGNVSMLLAGIYVLFVFQ